MCFIIPLKQLVPLDDDNGNNDNNAYDNVPKALTSVAVMNYYGRNNHQRYNL